jgi:hypothetical protein
MKHSNITINGRVLSRTTDGENMYGLWGVCGLTDSIGEPNINGKYKWAVRMNALQDWMCIGICRIRQAQ